MKILTGDMREILSHLILAESMDCIIADQDDAPLLAEQTAVTAGK